MVLFNSSHMTTIIKAGKEYATVSVFNAEALATPLVLSIPHSGEIYPDDFKPHADLTFNQYDHPADKYVHELFGAFMDLNIGTIKAEVARVYVDVNRRQYDLPQAIMANPQQWFNKISPVTDTSMIWQHIYGQPTYDRKLSNNEIRHRIASCYVPYHQALTMMLEQTRQKYGVVYLLDCHSMLSLDTKDHKKRPQIDIGTRGGVSCHPKIAQFLKDAFVEKGYEVGMNTRFAGGEITQRYGWPECGQHALQIEFRRDLYMDEETHQRNANFQTLQNDCMDVLERYNDYLMNFHQSLSIHQS